jgi:hypothetical protein
MSVGNEKFCQYHGGYKKFLRKIIKMVDSMIMPLFILYSFSIRQTGQIITVPCDTPSVLPSEVEVSRGVPYSHTYSASPTS